MNAINNPYEAPAAEDAKTTVASRKRRWPSIVWNVIVFGLAAYYAGDLVWQFAYLAAWLPDSQKLQSYFINDIATLFEIVGLIAAYWLIAWSLASFMFRAASRRAWSVFTALYAIVMVGVLARYLVEVKLDMYYGTDTMELIPFSITLSLFALPVVLCRKGLLGLVASLYRKLFPLRSHSAEGESTAL